MSRIGTSPVGVAALLVCLPAGVSSPVAAAQVFTPPPFEALDTQRAFTASRRLEELDARARAAHPTAQVRPPGALLPDTGDASDLESREILREARALDLDLRLSASRESRSQAVDEAGLPNRRIARFSPLVIADPYARGLPSPPPGRYYAKLAGRVVEVDAASEIVVRVLPETVARPADQAHSGAAPPDDAYRSGVRRLEGRGEH
ncbi:hypothetical protein GC169_07685 [bacterium]|nr:hypothetical protein [bacterium]